jgi:hypothetical protein
MRQLMWGAVLALGLTATVQQKAAAWTKFNFSVGSNICWQSGGGKWSLGFHKEGEVAPPPGAINPLAIPVPGVEPAPTPYPAPAGNLLPKTPPQGTQPAAYFAPAPAAPNYGYGYAQPYYNNQAAAPSYWYGK